MLHITIQNIKLSRNVAIYFGVMTMYSFSDWYIPCETLSYDKLIHYNAAQCFPLKRGWLTSN